MGKVISCLFSADWIIRGCMMGQDISKKLKNLEGAPFGLASSSNNWWKDNNHALNLKNGFISDSDIN